MHVLMRIFHALFGHLPSSGYPSEHPRAERRVPREWRG